MILRTGVDLVEIARIQALLERKGSQFLTRIYTPEEILFCDGKADSLAARFAAKEAVAKALGSGIGLVKWRELEVKVAENGEPHLVLHGAAFELANATGLSQWSLSLSHTQEFAIAFVVALG